MLNFSKINVLIIYLLFFIFAIFSILNLQNEENKFIEKKINLGLDLQGGSYLLLEINSDSLVEEKIQSKVIPIKKLLKDNGIIYDNFKINKDGLSWEMMSTLIFFFSNMFARTRLVKLFPKRQIFIILFNFINKN